MKKGQRANLHERIKQDIRLVLKAAALDEQNDEVRKWVGRVYSDLEGEIMRGLLRHYTIRDRRRQ